MKMYQAIIIGAIVTTSSAMQKTTILPRTTSCTRLEELEEIFNRQCSLTNTQSPAVSKKPLAIVVPEPLNRKRERPHDCVVDSEALTPTKRFYSPKELTDSVQLFRAAVLQRRKSLDAKTAPAAQQLPAQCRNVAAIACRRGISTPCLETAYKPRAHSFELP